MSVPIGEYLDVRSCTPVSLAPTESGVIATWHDSHAAIRSTTSEATIADMIDRGILIATALVHVSETAAAS